MSHSKGVASGEYVNMSIIKIRVGHSTITYILIKHLSIFKKYYVIYWIENKFYKNQNQIQVETKA